MNEKGRHRDQVFEGGKKKYYMIYGGHIAFFGTLCLIMGSASEVDNTFSNVLDTCELYLGARSYIEGPSIYDDNESKYKSDFTQQYYVRYFEKDIESEAFKIIDDNKVMSVIYHVTDIDIVYETENVYSVYQKGEMLAKIHVERTGIFKKISIHWYREKLDQL